MAPKRKKTTQVIAGHANAGPVEPLNVLSKDTLADLNYIEPRRSRDRIVSCLNELFVRVHQLEQMHSGNE